MKSIDYDAIADLYDTYVAVDIDLEFWRRRTAAISSEVLELMAGTGRVSLPLIRAGVRLVCVDYSAGLLEVLRRKLATEALTAEVHEMDVRALDLGRRFDLILLPFHAFSELVEAADQRAALRAIRSHLTSGGRFILTLHNPVVRLRQIDDGLRERGRFPRADGSKLVFCSESSYDPATGVVAGRQVYRLLDADGAPAEEREIPVRFVLPPPDEARALVEAEGFRVAEAWGDYRDAPLDLGSSPFVIWSLARVEPRCPRSSNRGGRAPTGRAHADRLDLAAAVIVRRATRADLRAVARLEKESFSGASFPAFFIRQAYDAFGELFLVAEEGAAVVAYGLGVAQSGRDDGWILGMAVARARRGQGIGAAILDELVAAFRRVEVARVLLTVSPGNVAARSLYEAHGFLQVDEEAEYFGPDEPRVLMARDL